MGQAAIDSTWEKVLEFKDAYPSFQLEDELFLNLGGGGCCGRIYRKDVSAPAQAREGPAGARRRKERHPLKMEGAALQVWRVLHLKIGMCRIRNQIEGD
jgi:hypothetical protein